MVVAPLTRTFLSFSVFSTFPAFQDFMSITQHIFHLSRISKGRVRVGEPLAKLHKGEQPFSHSYIYQHSMWNQEFIDSLKTPYNYQSRSTQLEKLKKNVKRMISTTIDPCDLLRHVYSIECLGVGYHFEGEISEALHRIQSHRADDLYTTALQFQVLREHNFPVSTDVFNKFMSRDGEFLDKVGDDVAGFLSLYEASHVGMDGEVILEKCMELVGNKLKALVGDLEIDVDEQVQQSLETPLHWRMPRVEARNFFDIYQTIDAKNLSLLELAKLDFNLVQSMYQGELKELSRWWEDIGFKNNLPFTRDGLVECYLMAIGIFEPPLSKCRIGLTKYGCILNAIDDMYDKYGPLDELNLFTDAVKRWDLNAMKDLPGYMKILYFCMYNYANELAYCVLLHHGFNPLPYLIEEWTKLCESHYVEAKWYKSGYKPSLDEYLKNSWISVGGHASIVFVYMLHESRCPITDISIDCFKNGYHRLIYWSSLIVRLTNDLRSSMYASTEDVPKSVECHMVERGVSQEEAENYIKGLIRHAWKMLNTEGAKNDLSKPIVKICFNMARTLQCIYKHGDDCGTGKPTGIIKDILTSLIMEAIPVEDQQLIMK